MQIFELHFNPKNKEGRLIDTFCYQPEDVYEKRLGALAIAGELTKGSSNKTLLNNLANKVKGTYHSLPTRTQEGALREGLKEGNKFLDNETWDGALNLAILSIKSDQLQFSKMGDLKILLSRNGEITNIGRSAEDDSDSFGSIVTGKIKKKDKLIILTDDIYLNFANEGLLIDLAENQPLNEEKLEKISKVQKNKFPKTPGVCLLVDFSIETKEQEKIVNKDEFSFQKLMIKTGNELQETGALLLKKTRQGGVATVKLLQEKGKPTLIKGGHLLKAILNDIKRAIKKILKTSKNKIEGVSKKTKEVSKKKMEELKENSKEREKAKSRTKREKSVKSNTTIEEVDIDENSKEETKKTGEKDEKGNLQKSIVGRIKEIKGIGLKLKNFIVQEGQKGIGNFKKLFQRIKEKNYLPNIPKLEIPDNKTKRKSLYLMVLLLIIILIGSITAHIERSSQLEDQRARLSEINQEISDININSDRAFNELLYHYQNLSDLKSRRIAYQSDVESLKNAASQKLLEITNTEIVEDPEVLFKTTEIVPSKIDLINGEIYSYNPFLSNAEKYNPTTEEQLVRPVTLQDGGIFSLSSTNNHTLFFSRPNEIVKANGSQTSHNLTAPYENYSYQRLEAYQNYLYFLERENNQIVRYNQDALTNPEIWIQERRPGNIKSFSIDGSIWMLKDNNEIWQYEDRRPVQGSLINHEEIFPLPERFTTIETEAGSPIYILEPKNNRVLISSKEGELLKQIILPKARNIKDLAIDQNKIYLLDSQEVYVLEVEL